MDIDSSGKKAAASVGAAKAKRNAQTNMVTHPIIVVHMHSPA
jgi:hypothetical protein